MRIDHAVLCAVLALASAAASAKETVKIAFVGPLTGGNSAIGLGGRNSADLAVKLRNQDPGFGDTIRNSQCQACDSLMSERSLVMQLAGPMHAAMSPSGELAAALAGSLAQAELPHRVAYGVPGSDLRIRQPRGQLRTAPQEPPVATERRLHSRAVCSSSGK